MGEVQWVTLGFHGYGQTHIRVDQIAAWSDTYYNGHQHYVDVTLTTGDKVHVEVDREQWDAFKKAVNAL